MSARPPRPASAGRPHAARPADVAKVGLLRRHSVQEPGLQELARVDDCRLLILRARRGGKTPKELQEIQQKLRAQQRRTGGRGLAGSKGRPASAGAARGKPGARGPGAAALQVRPASGVPAGTRRRNKKEEEVDELAAFKECMHKIVDGGLSLDFQERPFYRTALWEATWKNNEEIVRLLADKKADVCARDYQDRTPLHEAAYYGHDSLVKFLLSRGHPIDCEDVFGQTPLFRACEGGRTATVELLVDRGARTGGLDFDSLTLCQVAAFQGKPELANWLVSKGSYKNLHNMAEERPCPNLEARSRYERPLWAPPEARRKPPRRLDASDEAAVVPEALRRDTSPSRQAEARAARPSAAGDAPPPRAPRAAAARPSATSELSRSSTVSELPGRASVLAPRASTVDALAPRASAADGEDAAGSSRAAPSRESSRASLAAPPAAAGAADGCSTWPLAPGRPSLGRPASQPQLGRARASQVSRPSGVESRSDDPSGRGSISTLREVSMELADGPAARGAAADRPRSRGAPLRG